MDPTGLLAALLAVAVYPGGVFLAVATLAHRQLSGESGAALPPRSVPAARLVPALSAVIATAMLPLVGSPALRLPPPTGTAGNLVAVIVLLAVAADLGARSRVAAVLAGAAALPVLALAVSAGTLSVVAISTAGGVDGLAARALAAGVLVLASASTGRDRGASMVAAALALAAASLVVPAALGGATAVVGALACLGVVAASGILCRTITHRLHRGMATAGIAAAVAGTVLALLSGRT